MKKCKQCGRQLPESLFRPYYPRGSGIRKSTVGCNTICKSCETINSKATLLWRSDARTPEEEEIFVDITKLYQSLIDIGLDPIGPYAKHLRGIDDTGSALGRGGRGSGTSITELISRVKPTVNAESINDELDKFVAMKFTEHPSVYDAMYETIRTKCLNNEGQVVAQYKEKLGIAADKQMNYEETWN